MEPRSGSLESLTTSRPPLPKTSVPTSPSRQLRGHRSLPEICLHEAPTRTYHSTPTLATCKPSSPVPEKGSNGTSKGAASKWAWLERCTWQRHPGLRIPSTTSATSEYECTGSTNLSRSSGITLSACGPETWSAPMSAHFISQDLYAQPPPATWTPSSPQTQQSFDKQRHKLLAEQRRQQIEHALRQHTPVSVELASDFYKPTQLSDHQRAVKNVQSQPPLIQSNAPPVPDDHRLHHICTQIQQRFEQAASDSHTHNSVSGDSPLDVYPPSWSRCDEPTPSCQSYPSAGDKYDSSSCLLSCSSNPSRTSNRLESRPRAAPPWSLPSPLHCLVVVAIMSTAVSLTAVSWQQLSRQFTSLVTEITAVGHLQNNTSWDPAALTANAVKLTKPTWLVILFFYYTAYALHFVIGLVGGERQNSRVMQTSAVCVVTGASVLGSVVEAMLTQRSALLGAAVHAACVASAGLWSSMCALSVLPVPLRESMRTLVRCLITSSAILWLLSILPYGFHLHTSALTLLIPLAVVYSVYTMLQTMCHAIPPPQSSQMYCTSVAGFMVASMVLAVTPIMLLPHIHSPATCDVDPNMQTLLTPGTMTPILELAAKVVGVLILPPLLNHVQNEMEHVAVVHALSVAGQARQALLGRQVEELRDLKRQVLLMVSHELNTPLHEVLGCLDALISAEGSSSLPIETRPFAETAKTSAMQVSKLVRKMLDATQLQKQALEMTMSRVSILHLLRHLQSVPWESRDARTPAVSSASLYNDSPASTEKPVDANGASHLHLDIDDDLPYVCADSDRILQVLYELISNAFKYSSACVTASAVHNTDTSTVTVTVTDQGDGIPAHEVPSIWAPFHQVDTRSGASRSEEGLGLGLFLVREILAAHSTAIHCETTVGQGTSMSFSLPLWIHRKQSDPRSLFRETPPASQTAPDSSDSPNALPDGMRDLSPGMSLSSRADGSVHSSVHADMCTSFEYNQLVWPSPAAAVHQHTWVSDSSETSLVPSLHVDGPQVESVQDLLLRQSVSGSRTSGSSVHSFAYMVNNPLMPTIMSTDEAFCAPTIPDTPATTSAGDQECGRGSISLVENAISWTRTTVTATSASLIDEFHSPTMDSPVQSSSPCSEAAADETLLTPHPTGARPTQRNPSLSPSPEAASVEHAGLHQDASEWEEPATCTSSHSLLITAASPRRSSTRNSSLIEMLANEERADTLCPEIFPFPTRQSSDALEVATYSEPTSELCRRLYSRLPAAPLAPGYWSAPSNELTDSTTRVSVRDNRDSTRSTHSRLSRPRQPWQTPLPRHSDSVERRVNEYLLQEKMQTGVIPVDMAPEIVLESIYEPALVQDHDCIPPREQYSSSSVFDLIHESRSECAQRLPEVMSIDDNVVNQAVLRRMLTTSGFRFRKAMCAEEALSLLDSGDTLPDILLMDIMMPGINGLDLCREVRRRYPEHLLPTIFISSNCQPEHIVDGLAAGAQDYMTKPVNKQELVARINAQLQQRVVMEKAATGLAHQLLQQQLETLGRQDLAGQVPPIPAARTTPESNGESSQASAPPSVKTSPCPLDPV